MGKVMIENSNRNNCNENIEHLNNDIFFDNDYSISFKSTVCGEIGAIFGLNVTRVVAIPEFKIKIGRNFKMLQMEVKIAPERI